MKNAHTLKASSSMSPKSVRNRFAVATRTSTSQVIMLFCHSISGTQYASLITPFSRLCSLRHLCSDFSGRECRLKARIKYTDTEHKVSLPQETGGTKKNFFSVIPLLPSIGFSHLGSSFQVWNKGLFTCWGYDSKNVSANCKVQTSPNKYRITVISW